MRFRLTVVGKFIFRILLPLLVSSAAAQSIDTEIAPVLPQKPFDYLVENLPGHLRVKNRSSQADALSENPKTNDLVALGRVLFYDKHLSRNNLVSCSSCHKPNHGFDDPSRFSIGFEGKITSRNAMGLANIRFNSGGRFFWDLRAASLREQVLIPFFDPIEMGLKNGQLVATIGNKQYYSGLFIKAYGAPDISREKIAEALTGFILSLVSTNSPYDLARREVASPYQIFPSFSDQQNRGKMLFFLTAEEGGAGCFICHRAETFVSSPSGSNNGLDSETEADQGIGAITGHAEDMGKFRPPSLRNIAARAPYMHDGRFTDLEQVIDHYSSGINNHPNLDEALKDNNGQTRKFNFSQTDKKALVLFLETLTDQQFLSDPKFSDPFR